MNHPNVHFSVSPFSWQKGLRLVSKGELRNRSSWTNLNYFLTRYGLVAEQKKGSYKYFVDLGDRMEVAISRSAYVDEVSCILLELLSWVTWVSRNIR